MKLKFKNLLKFLIPIFGLAVLGSYYRYKYVLYPDGLRNSKGEFYFEKYGTYLDYEKFVDKCLSFRQDNSDVFYGEKRGEIIPATEYREEYNFVEREVTLKGFGSLINSCRHDVVIEKISMQYMVGDSKWNGGYESAFYPNKGYELEKDIHPINKINFPDGNILKANSSMKVELESTKWYYENPFINRSLLIPGSLLIPEKNSPIKFRLNYLGILNIVHYSIRLNEDNYDGKKLAEDGLAKFRIYFKNPHGKRSISFSNEECIVYKKGKVLKNGCSIKKWQIRSNGKPILNSKDFGKYLI
tara:strand:- start:360 stop:1259 length:900 start_codon:yes stop_codon:yes gene_type:complete